MGLVVQMVSLLNLQWRFGSKISTLQVCLLMPATKLQDLCVSLNLIELLPSECFNVFGLWVRELIPMYGRQ